LPVFPGSVRAECTEYKIVEYEDRVEAVCVGEPPTEAQIKAELEEQKKQDRETHRLRVEEQNRQREEARLNKARADAVAEAERRKQEAAPPVPRQNNDTNKVAPQRF
jgi:hypothetical protein